MTTVEGHKPECTVYLDGTGDCICDEIKAAELRVAVAVAELLADSPIMTDAIAEAHLQGQREERARIATETANFKPAYDAGYGDGQRSERERIREALEVVLNHHSGLIGDLGCSAIRAAVYPTREQDRK